MSTGTITFLTVINLLNYMDRFLLMAVLPLISAELQLTNEQSGRLVSAFVLGYFIFAPVFGFLGDRYSRPKLMAIGVLCWSLATIASGAGISYLSLLAIRIFVGIGEASFATISPGFIKDRVSDPARLNSILSIFFAAIPVGAALGYAFAGGIAGQMGWHAVFWFGGIPGLILAPFILRLKDIRPAPTAKEGPLKNGLQEILSKPILVYAILGYALQTFTLNAIAAFVTKYGVELGFEAEEISLNFGLILIATGLGGTLLGGKIASVLSKKTTTPIRTLFYICAVTSILGVPCLMGAFTVSSKMAFLIFCFLGEFVIFASTAPVNSIIVLTAPARFVTLTQGVTIATINLVGAMLGPILVGLVADTYSLSTGLQFGTLALAGSAVIWGFGAKFAGRAK